jgi:hypothetical protein
VITPQAPANPPMTLGNMREHGAHHLLAFLSIMILATAALIWTSASAFTPSDCGVTAEPGKPGLRQYCIRLRQTSIYSDSGHGLIGKLDKADPIEGEPESQHYSGSSQGMVGKRISTRIL